MIASVLDRGRFGGARTDGTLVLCYHAVSEDWPASLAVTPVDFRGQLEWLLRQGYEGATFHEAVASPPSGRKLVVTFDDGFHSVVELAYPILSSLGLPATLFVVTDFLEDGRALGWAGIDQWRGSRHDGELRALTWHEVEMLANDGWEIGSHTRSHPRLTQLGDDPLMRELVESREACERALGRPCRSLAYPYGDVDARVAAAAADAGYAAAAIEDVGRPKPLMWPRIGIYRGNSMRKFRLKVSPTMGHVRVVGRRVEAAARAARSRATGSASG